MKIKQTFTIEHPNPAQDANHPSYWELDRDQAEELLAALQEALGYGIMTRISPDFDLEDGSWEEQQVGEMLTPDEAAARLQAGVSQAGVPSPTGGMPAGWKGNSTFGTRSAE